MTDTQEDKLLSHVYFFFFLRKWILSHFLEVLPPSETQMHRSFFEKKKTILDKITPSIWSKIALEKGSELYGVTVDIFNSFLRQNCAVLEGERVNICIYFSYKHFTH